MPNFNGLWTSRQQMQARGGNTWPAVPGAPTSPVATAGNASASVAFTAPADTGYPAGAITGYRVTSTPGGFTGTGLTSPVTVTGLTNGTAYTFTVAAQNVNGYGPESVASNSVTPIPPNYIEEVFSTYLYTGNGATQTLTNGINLSGLGGLVWGKSRSNAYDNFLADSVRGSNKLLYSNQTYAQQTDANVFTAFNSNGFSLGVGGAVSSNTNGATYASWTFREQPKFFDVVTYTGNGSSITVPHSLGSAPGCIIVKRTDTTSDWPVYHRSVPSNCGFLNYTNSFGSAQRFSSVTSTNFTINVSTADVNASGGTYVAYLFAHDAGGFGLTGTDNVISCGSYTQGAGDTAITLGYEPQWVMIKSTDATGSSWAITDNMRAMPVSGSASRVLNANLSNAESSSIYGVHATATGFISNGFTSGEFIYIAIRRGPMAVPTLGTTVFEPVTSTSANDVLGSLQAFDMGLFKDRNTVANNFITDRLRGFTSYYSPTLYTNLTNAEATPTTGDTVYSITSAASRPNGQAYFGGAGLSTDRPLGYSFKRAPGFFDEVCYTGTSSTPSNKSHNLNIPPELIIIKSRSSIGEWFVGFSFTATDVNIIYLNQSNAAAGSLPYASSSYFRAAPTSTTFTTSSDSNVNSSAKTYTAYLFATLAGVSKVGSYTGTGATQTIACGFAAGARFVLIKRTDTTGDWYYWDSVRGMVVGTDPSLLLNTTAAEVNANSVYTITTGFQIVSTAAGINASGGTYIFLAIA